MGKRKTNNNKKQFYVNKEELVKEIELSQNQDRVTDNLAEMLIKIVNGVAHRFANLQYYGITEDVKQDCLLLLIQKYKNFDLTRNSSCFAYITTIIYNQMRYQVSKAKKYKDRNDAIAKEVKEYIDILERGY